MALQFSQRDIIRMKEQAERLKTRAKGALEKADEVVHTFIRTATIGATAFGFGVAQGRTGGIEVIGVPLELGAGVGAHLLAFMGVGGEYAGHLHNIADGALASYTTTLGRGVGIQWRADLVKKGLLKPEAGVPEAGVKGGEALSEADIKALAK